MFQRYMEMKYGPAKDYPKRAVTTEEFILLLMQTGKPEKEALTQAKIAKGMGSSVLVGKEWLTIKDTDEGV